MRAAMLDEWNQFLDWIGIIPDNTDMLYNMLNCIENMEILIQT